METTTQTTKPTPSPGATCSAVQEVRLNAHRYGTKKDWIAALDAARLADQSVAKARGRKPLKPMFRLPNAEVSCGRSTPKAETE